MSVRVERLAGFLKGFTGQDPAPELVADFMVFATETGT